MMKLLGRMTDCNNPDISLKWCDWWKIRCMTEAVVLSSIRSSRVCSISSSTAAIVRSLWLFLPHCSKAFGSGPATDPWCWYRGGDSAGTFLHAKRGEWVDQDKHNRTIIDNNSSNNNNCIMLIKHISVEYWFIIRMINAGKWFEPRKTRLTPGFDTHFLFGVDYILRTPHPFVQVHRWEVRLYSQYSNGIINDGWLMVGSFTMCKL